MTMVSNGPISLGGNATTSGLNQSVNIELGRAATATINMNESAVRTLAGVPSGAISMSNFYGKANAFAFTISSNQTNADLRTLAVNAGWNQSTRVIATIASGVIISSNSTGTAALSIGGSFPGGLELINNGVIVGMGGNGGYGANTWRPPFFAQTGFAGGTALSVGVATSINNVGTIAGGGGGGGGGGGWTSPDGKSSPTTGGGGGGGRSSAAANSSGGAGGSNPNTGSYASAGAAGTYSGPGGGGGGGPDSQFGVVGGTGGTGGGWGAAGATGGNSGIPFGSNSYPGQAGGAGGAAVSGNSNVTWIATGTRFGALT